MYWRIGIAFLATALCMSSALALPWSEDMRDQPSVKAQETVVELSDTSVPREGKETIETPENISELVQARLAAGALKNPQRSTPESINRGKELYDLHCAICHGSEGNGDGTVGLKFVPSPMNLNIDYVQLQPDGQLFFTISHGSIAMPYYRDAIPTAERWHLVNYVKEVLGQNQQ